MSERSKLDEIEDLHFGVKMFVYKGKTKEELTGLLLQRGANQSQIDLVFNYIHENYQGIRLLECSNQKRILNFIIDSVIIGLLSYVIFTFVSSHIIDFHTFFISMILMPFIYYFLLETIFARTIGKLITGTIVVDYNGKTPGLLKILFRTIGRYWLYGLNGFYGIFVKNRIFHDRISYTYVVDKQRWTKQYEIV